jgi:hypothetical protein
MRVTWDDLGRPTEPGAIAFQDGELNIKRHEIECFQRHPDAIFKVVRLPTMAHGVKYALGEYELP